MVDDKINPVKSLNYDNPETVTDTLLYIAYNVKDIQWAEQQLIKMVNVQDT
ncbi:hypothetical protein [Mangrovibacter sp. MFB070]|uniref:hypothetical protein n=1 Tax=Mangrovibacter sp. MFB070 TaxID=1224318 RepID=UPI001F205BF2|nr:hypothetical protein [Mangrovibacter sp. MFB070]